MGFDVVEEDYSSLHIMDEINHLKEIDATELIKNGIRSSDTPTIKSKHSTAFNIGFLIVLYTCQGFPIGMIEAFSIAMQLKGASYKSLGFLSFAFWPFSIKLIWAPIVDSFYSKRIGRRKSWLIPVQLLLGVLFFYLASEIDHIMSNVHNSSTVIWFVSLLTATMTLAATQDIAVDGWALAIFEQENVHLASICNSVGQTLGYVIANLAFLLLSSDSFCSKYLYFISNNNQKLFTESQLFNIFGWCFIVTTLIIAFGVEEHSIDDNNNDDTNNNSFENVKNSYVSLWQYFNLSSIKTLIFHLMFYKIGFAAMDALTSKKLIETGLDKNVLVLMSLPIIILQLCLPFLLDKYISMHGPLTIQSKMYPVRLSFATISFLLVSTANMIKLYDDSSSAATGSYSFPSLYLGFVLVSFILHQIPLYVMYVSSMGFFARISDPTHGGAQMTLLNTVCNLGTKWPNSLALLTVDLVTLRLCEDKLSFTSSSNCFTIVDGFYIQLLVCFMFGIIWYRFFKHSFCNLQRLPIESWRIGQKAKQS